MVGEAEGIRGVASGGRGRARLALSLVVAFALAGCASVDAPTSTLPVAAIPTVAAITPPPIPSASG